MFFSTLQNFKKRDFLSNLPKQFTATCAEFNVEKLLKIVPDAAVLTAVASVWNSKQVIY